MRKSVYIVSAAAGLLLTACDGYGKPQSVRESLQVAADVTIAKDSAGEYSFSYAAPYFKENGDFDFSQKGAPLSAIDLTFTIADGSLPGIKFFPDGPDAIWIVEKKELKDPASSPAGPYRGDQFVDFKVSPDGTTLTLTDKNDDGVLYRYALRFELDGQPVVNDPDGQNGPPPN